MVGRNRAVAYKAQNYEALRSKHQKLGTLFTDPIFPPTPLSICRNKNPAGNVIWKRPQDLCDKPILTLENDHLTITQGKLGKPWFVTACYALSNAQELWNKVIPNYRDQVWDINASGVTSDGETLENVNAKYAGIFHFQFWRYGKWIDVVVDDLLPVLSVSPSAPGSPSSSSSQESPGTEEPGLLLCTRSARPNEFWISLVEKAYAKLLGSYEALELGTLKDVLVDFTGGVSEEITSSGELQEDEKMQLFRTLNHEIQQHSIMCCTVEKDEEQENDGSRSEVGLVRGRMYILTAVKRVYLANTKLHSVLKGKDKVGMVRLKDPMERDTSQIIPVPENGEENVDDGAEEVESDSGVYIYPPSKLRRLFSKSPEWARVSDAQLTRLGLQCQTSNEFWMPWDDLSAHLCTFTVCRLFNTNVFALGKTWKERVVTGKWSRGAKGTSADRSGGGTAEEYPETFLRNPQFLFEVPVAEEEIVMQLIQWPAKTQEDTLGAPLAIALTIFQVEENRKYRMHSLQPCCPISVEVKPTLAREVYHRGHLCRGCYLVIPSTAIPGDSANFFLRVLSSNVAIKLRELKKDYPSKVLDSCLFCCVPPPVYITKVTIKGAEGLITAKPHGSCDPYCMVTCEGSKMKTQIVRNTRDPTWDASFIFYRYKMEKPIVVKVYNHNLCMPDNFLGEAMFPGPVNHQWMEIRADLINPKEKIKSEATNPEENVDSVLESKGIVIVELLTEDDVMAV